MNNNGKKRTTITLSFRRDSKKPSEIDISKDVKQIIAERQRQLLENKNKKVQENSVKKTQIKDENINNTSNIVDATIKQEPQQREEIKQENNVDKSEIERKKLQFQKEFKRNDFGKKNRHLEKFDKNNKKGFFGDRDRHDDFEKKHQEFGKKQDKQEKRDNKQENKVNNDKKEFQQKIQQQNKNNQQKNDNSNYSNNKKYNKSKNKEYGRNNNDDEENNKTDRRNLRDKSEKKMSKNYHTFIFNDEGELANEDSSGFIRRNKRNKNKDNNTENKNENKQKIIQTVNIPDFISVADLAERMSEKKAEVVKKLFIMGMKVNINQSIDADTAELIVREFGHEVKRVSDADIEKNILQKDTSVEKFVPRSPVVTVMGHVDHGKTSLLDALRSTRVADGEYGGITQHIGASRVEVKDGKFITFIDTPGHEAFTEMRMRGANITDIVVLVVAADDGIQNQTIEAINHTKVAKVPMIVAINKIDKPDANPNNIKQALLQHNVVLEEFGGDVMSVEVSAKNKTNIDKLLETILLQAEMLDLKANINCKANGAVIESKVDSQKGVLTTLLVQNGILKVGDIIIAGTSLGKVKKMIDDKRKTQDEAVPSMAVEILGFNTSPTAGDVFNVVATEKEAREIIAYRDRKKLEEKDAKRAGQSLKNLLQTASDDSKKKQVSVVIKTDVSGSIDAISSSLTKLSNDEINVVVIHSAVGIINESDINLANTSNAVVVGFNVRSTAEAKNLAKQYGITIKYYSIIYDIIDDIKAIMSGLLSPTVREEIVGQAEIRNIIKVSGVGKIAGCFVTEGEIDFNSGIRIIRDGVVVFTGKIKSLKRFKDDVKKVATNYECGISIDKYDDIKEHDIIECYKTIEEKREI